MIESRSDERCRLQCRCRVAQRRALWLRALVLSVDAVYMTVTTRVTRVTVSVEAWRH